LTSSNAALPAGYVLQPVDEQTMTSAESESHTKLEEMKVDLALLSDPATFACHLSAKLDGRAILVRGFVPNEAVRDRALQLAQSATHMTIADGLNLHPTLAMRSAGVPAASLQSGAAELLVTGFPEVAHGIEAKANITGQVTLTGSARSFEEKLAMSQRMLRLNGCTSVVNRVKVTPILRNGTSLTMVTADGMHVVPTEVAMGQPSASAAPNMPEVRVLSSTQGTGTIHAMQAPPAVPRPVQLSKPVESSSMVRPLPAGPAFPRDKGSNNPHSGVSQGLVTFSE
jgi:osmotically-inducible protein OsmY